MLNSLCLSILPVVYMCYCQISRCETNPMQHSSSRFVVGMRNLHVVHSPPRQTSWEKIL